MIFRNSEKIWSEKILWERYLEKLLVVRNANIGLQEPNFLQNFEKPFIDSDSTTPKTSYQTL